MSEWRHEPWDAEVTLFRRREDGTERGLYGWTEITAYLNDLEEYKALAERTAATLRAFVPVTASQPDIDALRKPWLRDYDDLKAQEAGK